jgi:hypothetical protein
MFIVMDARIISDQLEDRRASRHHDRDWIAAAS